MDRNELRQSLDDSVLTHTGHSIGDVASERVLDDVLPLFRAYVLEPGVKCENCGNRITEAVYCTMCDKTLCYECDAMWEHAEQHM
jgi:hypothetical protein